MFLGGSHWDSTGKPLLLVDPNCVLTEQLPGSDILWMFGGGGCGGQSSSANHSGPLLCTGRRFANQVVNCLNNVRFLAELHLIGPTALLSRFRLSMFENQNGRHAVALWPQKNGSLTSKAKQLAVTIWLI